MPFMYVYIYKIYYLHSLFELMQYDKLRYLKINKQIYKIYK